jgi:hypothetical protein
MALALLPGPPMRHDVVGVAIALAIGGLTYAACRPTYVETLPATPGTAVSVAEPLPPSRPTISQIRRLAPRETAASIAAHVRSAALRHRVAESLVAAVIAVESEFNPRAISHRGAQGLMQLMPRTAAGLGVRNAFDARENVDAGARHLRDLLNRFADDVPLALAAYNAGSQAVIDHGGVPPYPETQRFVARVIGRLERSVMPVPVVAATLPGRMRITARLTADNGMRPENGPAVIPVAVTVPDDDRGFDAVAPAREARPVVVSASGAGAGTLPRVEAP